MDARKHAALEQKIQRYGLAVADMQQARAGAQFLADGGLQGDAKRALETGVIVCYARPFSGNRGGNVNVPRWPRSLPWAAVRHRDLIEARHQIFAHTDSERGARTIEEVRVGERVIRTERFVPLRNTAAHVIVTLCDANIDHFEEVISKARRELGRSDASSASGA